MRRTGGGSDISMMLVRSRGQICGIGDHRDRRW